MVSSRAVPAHFDAPSIAAPIGAPVVAGVGVAVVAVPTVVTTPGVGNVTQVTLPLRCTMGYELVGSTMSDPGLRRNAVGKQPTRRSAAASGMTFRIVSP